MAQLLQEKEDSYHTMLQDRARLQASLEVGLPFNVRWEGRGDGKQSKYLV